MDSVGVRDFELGMNPPVAELTVEVLYQRHARDVFRMVHRLVGPGGSEDDVDDLVQQTFIAAHKALPKFRGDSRPTTWLYGIASRTVLTHLRSRRRYKKMLARLKEHTDERTPHAKPRQEHSAEMLHVWRALMTLSPKKRVAYVLHEIEGHSAPEISKMLRIAEPTVRSRLRHARAELAHALKESPRVA